MALLIWFPWVPFVLPSSLKLCTARGLIGDAGAAGGTARTFFRLSTPAAGKKSGGGGGRGGEGDRVSCVAATYLCCNGTGGGGAGKEGGRGGGAELADCDATGWNALFTEPRLGDEDDDDRRDTGGEGWGLVTMW